VLANQLELRLGGKVNIGLVEDHHAARSTQDTLDRHPAVVVPVGELGLTRNLSGAGSSTKSVVQVTLRRWDGPTASPHALDTEAPAADT